MVSLRLAIMLLFGSLHLWSQDLDQATKHAVIERFAAELRQNYVTESIGNQMADHLLAQEKAQAYAAITDPKLFARRLTEDVYPIAKDKHLRVFFNNASAEVTQNPDTELADGWKRRESGRERNNGYAAVQVLEGNIGYLEVTGFSGIHEVKAQADAAFVLLRDVEALILDLRRNGGGDPTGVQYLCSYLLPEKVHLNSLRYRHQPEFVSHTISVPGKRLLDIPVYVLTSQGTFSGGEECSYNLQTQKRAMLIGETTGGGANPGDHLGLGHGFSCFMPQGMAVNPITGTNWEGVGVVPEVACPASEALTLAKARAMEAINAARELRLAKYMGFNPGIRMLLSNPEGLAEKEHSQAIVATLAKAVSAGIVDEAEINAMGYSHLRDKPAFAELLFRANVGIFPNSSNTYDSYGEALAAAGKRDEAIAAYTKAIEVAKAHGDENAVDLHQQGLARVKP